MKRSGGSGGKCGTYRMLAIVTLGLMLSIVPSLVRAQCVGDCKSGNSVTVDDLLTMVGIALGTSDISACTPGDADSNQQITIDEILAAVHNALIGCPVPMGVCGDGTKDTSKGEDCDVGGTCIGGSTAGTHCASDSQCGLTEEGVCVGGVNDGTACMADAECNSADSKCVRCKTFGGATIPNDPDHTCASNCTFEHDVVTTLVTGQLTPDGLPAAGSTSYVDDLSLPIGLTLGDSCVGGDQHGIPCPNGDGDCARLSAGGKDGVCTHSTTTAKVGKELNGKIPQIIKATDIKFSPIAVPPVACACVRGVVYKTCGGTIKNRDGTPTTNCADTRYGGGGVNACTGKNPCTEVFGPGNAAAGTVGCTDAGLDNIDFTITQDHAKAGTMCTTDTASVCAPESCVKDPNKLNCSSDMCCGASDPVYSFSGHGPAGSAVVLVSNAIGTVVGDCIFKVDKTAYGADGFFCTDDDGEGQPTRGVVAIAPLVTGKANGSYTHVNGTNATLGCTAPGVPAGCIPDVLEGSPFSCSELAIGKPTGGAFAGAFTQVNSPTLADTVVTNRQEAQ